MLLTAGCIHWTLSVVEPRSMCECRDYRTGKLMHKQSSRAGQQALSERLAAKTVSNLQPS
jgi:hypothetical protein